VVQLIAAFAAVAVMDTTAQAPTPSADAVSTDDVRGAQSPPEPDPREVREQAVRALLDARSAAVLDRDRDGFLAGVWGGDPAFFERQAALFDNLGGVPLGDFDYDLNPRTDGLPSAELDAKYGVGQWWSPEVVLRYAIAEFDPEPTFVPHRFTFVRVGETWTVGSDDDFEEQGLRTTRALWDYGPVVTERGDHTLVLGHPGSELIMREIAEGIDAAVPRVTGVWGPWGERVVALVPNDQEELDRVLGGTTDLSRIAAVATAELTDVDDGYHAVGNRVLVNPPNFAKLGRLGRQVVLTHETTHVATRQATGPDAPTWLVEGLADYVAYLDVPVPVASAARETEIAIQEGRVPDRLPADADFDGANPDLPMAYETSWLAVRLLVDTHGLERTLAFYRAVGASRAAGADTAVARGFAEHFGTTPEAFTQAWREHLVSTFS
jgi:hypothetical protein